MKVVSDWSIFLHFDPLFYTLKNGYKKVATPSQLVEKIGGKLLLKACGGCGNVMQCFFKVSFEKKAKKKPLKRLVKLTFTK